MLASLLLGCSGFAQSLVAHQVGACVSGSIRVPQKIQCPLLSASRPPHLVHPIVLFPYSICFDGGFARYVISGYPNCQLAETEMC